jgi:tripartite-type tricarboxylate transporter receptor subunit TctC
MRFTRPLAAAAAAALALTAVGCASLSNTSSSTAPDATAASDWPNGPVTMIVAFDAGGGSDIGARLLATALEDELGVPIVVENRPGAGGQVGYTALANSAPDGSTFGLTTIPGLIVSALDESRNAGYEVDSFAQAALQVIDPMAIAVMPDSEIQSIDDLIAAAKEGELTATTTGIGTAEHIALLQFNEAAGTDIRPVHFADGAAPATTAFLGGNVDILLSNVGDIMPTIENGGARAIGVMAEERSIFVPDAATTYESGIELMIGSSRGYVFPEGTPQDIVDRMSEAIGTVLEDEEFQEQMANAGLQPAYMDAAEYEAYWNEQADSIGSILELIREEG